MLINPVFRFLEVFLLLINTDLRWTGFRAWCCLQKEPGEPVMTAETRVVSARHASRPAGRGVGVPGVMGNGGRCGPLWYTMPTVRVPILHRRVTKMLKNHEKSWKNHEKWRNYRFLRHKRIISNALRALNSLKFTEIHHKSLSKTPQYSSLFWQNSHFKENSWKTVIFVIFSDRTDRNGQHRREWLDCDPFRKWRWFYDRFWPEVQQVLTDGVSLLL